jgi:hypothetical protein
MILKQKLGGVRNKWKNPLHKKIGQASPYPLLPKVVFSFGFFGRAEISQNHKQLHPFCALATIGKLSREGAVS